MKRLLDMKSTIINELTLTDPIIRAALEAYGDTDEAICAALIAHARDWARLVDELASTQSMRPIVFQVSGSAEAEPEEPDAQWTVEKHPDGGYRIGLRGVYEAVLIDPYQLECTLNSLQRRVAGGEKPYKKAVE